MGVKTCDRNGCAHIMCDTYVPGVGYICDSCKKEFRTYLIGRWGEDNILKGLKEFMDSTPVSSTQEMDVDEFFKQYT